MSRSSSAIRRAFRSRTRSSCSSFISPLLPCGPFGLCVLDPLAPGEHHQIELARHGCRWPCPPRAPGGPRAGLELCKLSCRRLPGAPSRLITHCGHRIRPSEDVPPKSDHSHFTETGRTAWAVDAIRRDVHCADELPRRTALSAIAHPVRPRIHRYVPREGGNHTKQVTVMSWLAHQCAMGSRSRAVRHVGPKDTGKGVGKHHPVRGDASDGIGR